MPTEWIDVTEDILASDPTAPPISASIDAYIEACRNIRRLAPLTVRCYRRDLEEFATLIDGPFLNTSVAQNAIRTITENPRFKVKTIKRKLASIRGFLRSRDEDLAFAVFKALRYQARSPRILPRSLSSNELTLLLREAARAIDQTTYLALLILTSTGLRVSEMCALKLAALDVEKGELKVFGKGSKERVVIVTNGLALSALRLQYKDRIGSQGSNTPLLRDCRGKNFHRSAFG